MGVTRRFGVVGKQCPLVPVVASTTSKTSHNLSLAHNFLCFLCTFTRSYYATCTLKPAPETIRPDTTINYSHSPLFLSGIPCNSAVIPNDSAIDPVSSCGRSCFAACRAWNALNSGSVCIGFFFRSVNESSRD